MVVVGCEVLAVVIKNLKEQVEACRMESMGDSGGWGEAVARKNSINGKSGMRMTGRWESPKYRRVKTPGITFESLPSGESSWRCGCAGNQIQREHPPQES